MFLNGSDISNVKGYAFSRAATLTEVSILNRIELKLNHHSILDSKKSSWRKIMTFFKLLCDSLWKIHKWKMFHIFLWNLTLIYDQQWMKKTKKSLFFAAKYYYNTSQEKIQKRKYFYCIFYHYHMLLT